MAGESPVSTAPAETRFRQPQRSPGLMAGERWIRHYNVAQLEDAATEPRPDGRGEAVWTQDSEGDLFAATEPRPDGRGEPTSKPCAAGSTPAPQRSPGLMAGESRDG